MFSAVPSPVVATRGPSPLQQTPIASQHPPHAQATVSLTEGTPTIADQWYYAQQGQQKGPLSEEQLRQLATSGQIQPTDLAWKQGMASWMPASQIQGLIFPQSACVTTSMYCRNCGKPVDARAVACVSCGLVPSNGNNYCRICGANTHPSRHRLRKMRYIDQGWCIKRLMLKKQGGRGALRHFFGWSWHSQVLSRFHDPRTRVLANEYGWAGFDNVDAFPAKYSSSSIATGGRCHLSHEERRRVRATVRREEEAVVLNSLATRSEGAPS